ncbi:RimK family alpha-L-glutamate ligase [Amycolatopsis sp. NPDC059021]|uniref:ATP-grasp domain-containing protein n=1 Tax=Amycolatopsis sp. NPDC059021 TaxID=3346704 RepID=UPI00366DAA78
MTHKRIALVTSTCFPEDDWADRDSPLLGACLGDKGYEVDTVAWDAPGVPWHSYDLVVLQSPWIMWRKLAAFGAWLESVGRLETVLANPYEVVVGGMSKFYLPRVEREGAATIPTAIFRPGDQVGAEAGELLDRAEADFGARAVVVKPISSGGALGAVRITAPAELAAKLRDFAGEGTTVCVQPYIPSIDTAGEVGAIMIDGRLSHVITKDAILQEGTSRSNFHPNARTGFDEHDTDIDDIYTAYKAYLATVEAIPVSVRLDFLRHPRSGRLLLLEIESVAPVKFLDLYPPAVESYAEALVGLLERTERQRGLTSGAGAESVS